MGIDEQIYREMAEAMGIDLSDPEDPVAQMVHVGLRDRNPERVLRNCTHLFVSLGNQGPLASALRLPEAGSKLLHCTLHNRTIEGKELDSTFQAMKDRF